MNANDALRDAMGSMPEITKEVGDSTAGLMEGTRDKLDEVVTNIRQTPSSGIAEVVERLEVQTLTNDKATSQTKYQELQKQAGELEARTKELEREMAGLRVESEIVVEVKAARGRRDYKRLPVLLECYARPARPGDTFLQQYVHWQPIEPGDAPAAGGVGSRRTDGSPRS